MILRCSLGQHIPFVLSTILFRTMKGENNYLLKQTNMMETEPSLDISLSSVLVTFVNENLSQFSRSCGRRNWLPHNILIVGAISSSTPKESWHCCLGDYPEEFCYWMDFICCDLDLRKV